MLAWRVGVWSALVGAAALALGGSALAQAAPLPPIFVGMTAPLSGGDAAYGRGLRHGVELAIARANEAGGVSGRRIELVALDDRGDPSVAEGNARELLRRGVLAITGVHGAPAAAAVARVIHSGAGAAVAALVAPATGAEALREPARPGVFHVRASTFDEMDAAMLHLDTVGVTRYGLVVQDGMFGESARASLELQLVRIGLKPVVLQRMGAGDDTRAVMGVVCAAQPQVAVLALDASRVTALVDAGRAIGCAVQYLVFSETGAALAGQARVGRWRPPPGLMITQVTPHSADLSQPLVAEYHKAVSATASDGADEGGRYPSIEGYRGMRVLHEALRACSSQLSRSCVLDALANRTLEVAGQRIQFGATQRQARPFVEMTLLDTQGRFRR